MDTDHQPTKNRMQPAIPYIHQTQPQFGEQRVHEVLLLWVNVQVIIKFEYE